MEPGNPSILSEPSVRNMPALKLFSRNSLWSVQGCRLQKLLWIPDFPLAKLSLKKILFRSTVKFWQLKIRNRSCLESLLIKENLICVWNHQWLFGAGCKFLSWSSQSWLEEACGVEWDGSLGSRGARDLKIEPSIIFIFGFSVGGKDKISQVACAKTLIWGNNFTCASFTHN